MQSSQIADSPGPENTDRVYNTLQSLRRSFIRIGVLVLAFSVAGYYLAEPILKHLRDVTDVRLAAYGIPETFFTFLTLALAIGVFASLPFILYAILAGIQPMFSEFSTRMMRGFWLASVVLFYAGVAFCMNLTLPYGVEFLLEYEGPYIEAIISVEKFVGFCLVFVFGFGILFELPLAMILLGRIGVVKRQSLARNRRYAILLITIISAIMTPTPDAFNLAMMAVPLYLLFEIGLLGMRLYQPK
jgi:sec-independent protein translocase protein TatC